VTRQFDWKQNKKVSKFSQADLHIFHAAINIFVLYNTVILNKYDVARSSQYNPEFGLLV
jgi:hypothetical protein